VVLVVKEVADSNPKSTRKTETRVTQELHPPEMKSTLGLMSHSHFKSWQSPDNFYLQWE